MPTVIAMFRWTLISLATLCSCFGPLDPFNPPPSGIDDDGTTPVNGFPAGLVAWYTCNDSSTTLLSDTIDTAGKYNGQIAGCTRESGLSGLALRFNGSSDVTVKDSVARFGTGDFTISLWVKPRIIPAATDTTQYNIISNGLAGERGFTVAITRNSFSAFVGSYDSFSFDTTSPANAEKWRHLALSRSSGTVRLFVDGKQTQTYPNESDVTTNQQLVIGKDASEPREYRNYTGLIDEIKIISRAWDASDVNKENQRFPH